jgi:hypothetical protein
MNPKKRKVPKYGVNKKAFDTVMKAYRETMVIGTVGAIRYGASKGSSLPNKAKPTPLDFRCDVDRVITKCNKTPLALFNFNNSYVWYDSDDTIDIEIHAQKLLGNMRHGLEQGMGAEFVKRKLFPTAKYFKSVRQNVRY